jgi:hypothetical protein
MHLLLFLLLRGIARTIDQQREDQEDNNVHIVVFLAQNYEDNISTRKEVMRTTLV